MKTRFMTIMLCMIALSTCALIGCTKTEQNTNSGNSGNNSDNDENPSEYVDLGLPKGTKWKDKNENIEGNTLFSHNQAMQHYGSKMPTKEQIEELKNSCLWTWTGNGYNVLGPNGNAIFLPAEGHRDCTDGNVYGVNNFGNYWTSTPENSESAWRLLFDITGIDVHADNLCCGYSVRLVKD